MPRISNLACLPDESPNLEAILDNDLPLWTELLGKGYEVTMPDVLGFSAPQGISWFLEVGEVSTVAYMWSQPAKARVGNRFIVAGSPAAAVAKSVQLLEGTAAEEALSGAPLFHGEPRDELVSAA